MGARGEGEQVALSDVEAHITRWIQVLKRLHPNGVLELGPSSSPLGDVDLLGSATCVDPSIPQLCHGIDTANGSHLDAVNGTSQLISNGHHHHVVHHLPTLLPQLQPIQSTEELEQLASDMGTAASGLAGHYGRAVHADEAMRPAESASLDMVASTSAPASEQDVQGGRIRARHRSRQRNAGMQASPHLPHTPSPPVAALKHRVPSQTVKQSTHSTRESAAAQRPEQQGQPPRRRGTHVAALQARTSQAVHSGQSVRQVQPARQATTQSAAQAQPQCQSQTQQQARQVVLPPERALTVQITACNDVQSLQQLLDEHEPSMNHIHVSAMLVRLARLQQKGTEPGHQSATVDRQSAAVSTHASPASQAAARPGLQQRHQLTSQSPALSGPRTLPQQPALPPSARSPALQHSANGAASVSGAARQSCMPSQSQLAVRQLAVRLAGLALEHMKPMTLWEVTCVMSSLVKLRAPLKKSYYISFMGRARKLFFQPTTTVQGLAELLWAVARSGMRGLRADWAALYCSALEAHWADVDVRSATRVLHALAWLQHVPADSWMAVLLSKVQGALANGQATSQDVSMTLWALARLRYPVPAPFVAQLVAAAGSHMATCTSQELPSLMWGMARLAAPTPSPAWQAAACERVLQLLPQLTGQGLALVVYAAGLLRMSPPPGWLHTVLHYTQRTRFRELTPQGMALLVYGVSQLNQQLPDTWLHAFHAHIEGMQEEFKPAAVELIQSAFSTLQFDSQGSRQGSAQPSSSRSGAPGSNGHSHTHDRHTATRAAPSLLHCSNGTGAMAEGHAHVNGTSVAELLAGVEEGIEWGHGSGSGSRPAGAGSPREISRQYSRESPVQVVRPARFAR